MSMGRPGWGTTLLTLIASAGLAAEPRARDLGVPFDFGRPGPLDAITDVPGVQVGHLTLVRGQAVRTGVTAILPRGRGQAAATPCFAGVFALNGNGEMTGTAWIKESGLLDGPVLLTNTNAVGVVRDALIGYAARHFASSPDDADAPWSLPVVAETWDGWLNDIRAGSIQAEDAVAAVEAASSGPVAEGSVGGGTGMVCFEWKGGIGTASRHLAEADGGHMLGVLVQANFGLRHQARIAGVPVGLELPLARSRSQESGSIIVVLATDAPLLPHQLERLARRVSLGLARTGSVAGNGSGDLFIAFSTANPQAGARSGLASLSMLPNERMGPLFEATVGATEEAVVNALVAARSMTGFRGRTVEALPLDRLREVLARYGRLAR